MVSRGFEALPIVVELGQEKKNDLNYNNKAEIFRQKFKCVRKVHNSI